MQQPVDKIVSEIDILTEYEHSEEKVRSAVLKVIGETGQSIEFSELFKSLVLKELKTPEIDYDDLLNKMGSLE